MPSDYAHYRFGIQAIPTLPKDIQRSIRRFRQLYDVGLHGPDPFFHYNIVRKTAVGQLGSSMHRLTGVQFFTRACNRLRLHPTEAGAVYLYGFLGHYCLDSVCHPFVHAHTDEGPIGHVELETEFDRFLLEKDGRTPPYAQDLSRHMRLSRNEADTAAEFLSPATGADFYRATRNMARHTHLLATVDPRLLSKALAPLGKEIAHQQRPARANENCAFLDQPFLELYCHALDIYPEMVRQLTEHIRHRSPFGKEFSTDFG